jgi:hypothetical protein
MSDAKVVPVVCMGPGTVSEIYRIRVTGGDPVLEKQYGVDRWSVVGSFHHCTIALTKEVVFLNDQLAALAAEVERLRGALEGTIDPDTGHYWECIAGQRGHGQCSQLCERLRRALEEKDD